MSFVKEQSSLHTFFANILFEMPQMPLSISRCNYSGSTDPKHKHFDFCEMVVVYHGSAYNITKNDEQLLSTGSVFMMMPGSIHQYTNMNDFCHYNILFDHSLLDFREMDFQNMPSFRALLKSAWDSPELISEVMYLNDHALAEIVGVLDSIQLELNSKQLGWETASFAEFVRFLVYLSRYLKTSVSDTDHYTHVVAQAVQYLENNLEKNITLDILAKRFNMSISNFRHSFRKVTGSPPIDYLIKLRLKRATQLLSTTYTLEDIAEQVGLGSANYLSRLMKKHYDITPRQLRRSHNKLRYLKK